MSDDKLINPNYTFNENILSYWQLYWDAKKKRNLCMSETAT